MSEMRHERPGVYSVYDASSVTSAGRAAKRIGVAALAVKETANTAVTLTGYGAVWRSLVRTALTRRA